MRFEMKKECKMTASKKLQDSVLGFGLEVTSIRNALKALTERLTAVDDNLLGLYVDLNPYLNHLYKPVVKEK